jgi:hypothetical protein
MSFLEQSTTSAFEDQPRRMLKIIRFGKHCSYHLQGEYVMVGRFWQPYIGHRWASGFDCGDWWGGKAGCYPIGDEHVAEKKR